MKRQSGGAGFGLYFIDILACMVFCLTLALVGARFGEASSGEASSGEESSIEIDLPKLARADGTAPGDLVAPELSLREEAAGTVLYFDEQPMTPDELGLRLEAASFERVVLRLEASLLTEVIARTRAAGVSQIEIAYDIAQHPASGGNR